MESRAVATVAHRDAGDEFLAGRASEDFEAFAELYRRYEGVVFRAVRARTPSDDIAEGITAHVFFKALMNADDWRGEGNYSTWLHRIARNSISTWRRCNNRRATMLEVVPDMETLDGRHSREKQKEDAKK